MSGHQRGFLLISDLVVSIEFLVLIKDTMVSSCFLSRSAKYKTEFELISVGKACRNAHWHLVGVCTRYGQYRTHYVSLSICAWIVSNFVKKSCNCSLLRRMSTFCVCPAPAYELQRMIDLRCTLSTINLLAFSSICAIGHSP